MAEKDTKRKNNPLLIVIIVLLVALIAMLAYFLLRKQPEEQVSIADQTNLGYADATVYTDQEELQRAVDEMFEKARNDPGISLSYNETANSTDGTNFSCRFYNSQSNTFDVFISVFPEDDSENALFQSGLLRPGTGLESFTTSEPLSSGDHPATLVYTRVYNEDGKQVIDDSVSVYLLLHVD